MRSFCVELPRYVALLMLAALCCLSRAQAESNIVVGQVVDQSGGDVESSRDYVIGAKIYFDYVNANGGINGARIRQIVRDGAGDPQATLQLTRDLIEKENVDVLFGYVGERAIRAVADSDVLTKAHIALVSPLTGLIGGPEGAAKNLFVSRAPYTQEFRKVIEHFQTISVNRFALVSTRADLSDSLLPAMRQIATESKAAVVYEHLLKSPDETASVLKQAAAAGAQVLVVIGDGIDVGLIAHTLADRKVALPLVGLSLANHRVVIQIAGARDAFGVLLAQVVPDPLKGDTAITREHTAFMKRYLDEPPSHLTLEGFMAAKALVDVLRDTAAKGKLDNAPILKAMRAMPRRDVGGVTIDYARTAVQFAPVELTMVRADGSLLR